MKVDLYNNESRYISWKKEATKPGYIEPNLTKKNSNILIRYIFDMETGANVSTANKKGGRSYARLNALRTRLVFLFKHFQNLGVLDITKVKEQQLHDFFNDMRKGVIKTKAGEKYKSIKDYVKDFKSFWHWYQRISRKRGKEIIDITAYIDSKQDEKPKWVYLDENKMNLLLEKCDPRYKPLISFLFDSGARVTEAFSLLVQDIHEEKGVVYVDIKDEYSKTFGRKIKLLLCGKDLLEYIKRSELKPQDRLFSFSHAYVNRYLGKLAFNLFGDAVTKAGQRYSDLSMYDFRHNSSCYWIQRYKNNAGLMYRFGWKTEKYILYYSEFLGMRDLISSEDLYVDITKTELEKELEKMKLKEKETIAKLEKIEKALGYFLEDLNNVPHGKRALSLLEIYQREKAE